MKKHMEDPVRLQSGILRQSCNFIFRTGFFRYSSLVSTGFVPASGGKVSVGSCCHPNQDQYFADSVRLSRKKPS